MARLPARLALIGLLVGALGLAACGRKGPLDLPPQAQAQQPPPGGAAQPEAFDAAGNPVAPRGERRSLPLDWLLN